jgi:hypothetical protein
MPYDPNTRMFRPDFQADNRLPEWVPMDDGNDVQNGGGGSFVDALKKRMSAGKDAEAGGMAAGKSMSGMAEGLAGGGMAKGGAMPGMAGKDGPGGGMKSL